jgi:hypothetical protein
VMEKSMSNKIDCMTGVWFCLILILLAVASRLVPHPPNFTPLAAIGLFAGACLTARKLWLVPCAALLISDLVIGFYPPVVMAFVYVAFVLNAYLGRAFLHQQRTIARLGWVTVSGSMLFFILSNLGDWLSGMNYPLTAEGLMQCYIMAIPFFGNTLSGDLFYSACLFGAYAMGARKLVDLRTTQGA